MYLLFLAFSFSVLYFCTASSPRYAINPWNDSNAFLTVGKSMANGLIIYKDIFEQKGPLLYLIHALACLISDTSFTGVYFFQSVSLSVMCFAAYKIATLYIGTGWSIISATLTCFLTVNSACYYYGDSAEEFCLPLLMISLYYFCRYFKDTDQYKISKLTFFLIGFFAGCVAMIKFTVIGFWFAWAAYISLYTWIAKKDFKNAFVNAMIFLGGMATAIIPWVVYFAINGALYDFINVYFILNATAYPKSENLPLLGRLARPVYLILESMYYSPLMIAFSIISNILFLITNIFTQKKFFSRISVPFVFFVGIYLVYFGLRSYAYYSIPMSAFTIFVFISVFALLERIFKKKSSLISAVLCIALIVSSLIGANHINLSSKHVARKDSKTAQIIVADYIRANDPSKPILNYGCLDSGVYLLTNQVPQFKHFEHQNFNYDSFKDNVDEQNRYIDEHLAYYVVTTGASDSPDEIYEKNATLQKDYRIVMCQKTSVQASRNIDTEYVFYLYLFELNED